MVRVSSAQLPAMGWVGGGRRRKEGEQELPLLVATSYWALTWIPTLEQGRECKGQSMGRSEAADTLPVVMELRKKLWHDPGLHSKIWEKMSVFGPVKQMTTLQSVLRKTLWQASWWGWEEKGLGGQQCREQRRKVKKWRSIKSVYIDLLSKWDNRHNLHKYWQLEFSIWRSLKYCFLLEAFLLWFQSMIWNTLIKEIIFQIPGFLGEDSRDNYFKNTF